MSESTPQDNSPIKSADKAYYKSRDVSVINNRTAMTRHGLPGEPLHTARTPGHDPADMSTDRYYRDGGSKQSNRGLPSGKVMVPLDPQKRLRNGQIVAADVRRPQGTTYNAPDGAQVAVPINVHNKTEVNAAKEAIFAAIERGEPTVYVQVADDECERRIQAVIELGVARGQITEDRVRDVKISRIMQGAEIAKEMFGEIEPTMIPVAQVVSGQVGSGAEIDDFAAYVKGDQDDDSPTAPTSSVGVSTGELGDPVVNAARGEKPMGDEKPSKNKPRVPFVKPISGKQMAGSVGNIGPKGKEGVAGIPAATETASKEDTDE